MDITMICQNSYWISHKYFSCLPISTKLSFFLDTLYVLYVAMAEKPLSSGQKWWVFPGFGGDFVLKFFSSFFCFGDRKCRYRDIAIQAFFLKPQKPLLATWKCFLAIATYKNAFFSKSCNVPILKFCGVIPFPSQKVCRKWFNFSRITLSGHVQTDWFQNFWPENLLIRSGEGRTNF